MFRDAHGRTILIESRHAKRERARRAVTVLPIRDLNGTRVSDLASFALLCFSFRLYNFSPTSEEDIPFPRFLNYANVS